MFLMIGWTKDICLPWEILDKMIKVQPLQALTYINFRGRLDTRPKYVTDKDTFDSFTGLKDKRALLIDIGREMYKKEDISIGMFDLDNFKSVNELLGYKVGDDFIKAVAESIFEVAEKHKMDAYRFGGDEFVVLLFRKALQEEKTEIINDILNEVSQNYRIQCKSEDYMRNAEVLLTSYEKDNCKVNAIHEANTKYEILLDIWENSTIAKEDTYVQQSLEDARYKRDFTYLSVLDDCIKEEQDSKVVKLLTRFRSNVEEERDNIDNYIIGKYDKNHEAFRLKKWMKDFEQNGFSLTGGIVSFKPSYYIDKQPIDLINNVGEFLKQGKTTLKGKAYMMEIE